jgi:hypothetical protein
VAGITIALAGSILVIRHARPGRSVGEVEAEERDAAEARATAMEAGLVAGEAGGPWIDPAEAAPDGSDGLGRTDASAT